MLTPLFRDPRVRDIRERCLALANTAGEAYQVAKADFAAHAVADVGILLEIISATSKTLQRT